MKTTINDQIAPMFGAKLNAISPAELFQQYEEIGFIYPAKKALLCPHFPQITNNWEKMLQKQEDLLWVMTVKDQFVQENFASITTWKQSNYGLFSQHLVSTGNPFLSLKVMLAAQYVAGQFHDATEIRASQNWFRPNNRYAYRVFASMHEKLGATKSNLRLFQYLHSDVNRISSTSQSRFEVEEVTSCDPELIHFIKKQYGEVFVQGEELNQTDIQLQEIGKAYAQAGLHRSRKVYKIKERRFKEVVGAVVVNRAPLGLNFSFLENRAYYIFDEQLHQDELAIAISTANEIAKPHYSDFELQAIPIVTDKHTAKVLLSQGASFKREYMQSIWLRSGFKQWYEHIESFLKKIESRSKMKRVKGKTQVGEIAA